MITMPSALQYSVPRCRGTESRRVGSNCCIVADDGHGSAVLLSSTLKKTPCMMSYGCLPPPTAQKLFLETTRKQRAGVETGQNSHTAEVTELHKLTYFTSSCILATTPSV